MIPGAFPDHIPVPAGVEGVEGAALERPILALEDLTQVPHEDLDDQGGTRL